MNLLRPTGKEFGFMWIGFVVLIAILLVSVSSCDAEHPAQVPKAADGWVEMGKVSDSSGGCSVWKKKDDNGKVVYVAIGVNSCSVCAVDEKKP